jgi:O-antigen/teichoic acid export membrane protein
VKLFSSFSKLRGWKPGTLARNTFFASGWQVVRIGLQVGYLILAARMLGADGYGWFAGTLAMAASLSPLVGIGFGLILVKQVARQPESLNVYWARNIAAVLISSPILMFVVTVLAVFLLPEPKEWKIVGLLLLSELLFAPLLVVCTNVYQAHEKLGRSTFVHVILNLLRLLASIVLILVFEKIDVEIYGWGYFVATLGALLVVSVITIKEYGLPVWYLHGMLSEYKEGLGFSVSLVVGSTQAELDKTLVLRMANAESAGIYSVASRVISASIIPLVSFMLAAVPRLFREGEKGVHAGAQLVRKLLAPAIMYGVIAGFAIYVSAPLIPLVLGSEFSDSVDLIRLLAPMPFLSGLSVMLLSAYSCSGAQVERVTIELITLGLSIILNLVLIPTMGAKGAAVAALCTQAALTSVLLVRLFQILQKV